jgi:hypothetical protein
LESPGILPRYTTDAHDVLPQKCDFMGLIPFSEIFIDDSGIDEL